MDQPKPMTLVPEDFGLFTMPFQRAPLFVLSISNREGDDAWLCLDEATATTILYSYVQDWWGEANADGKIPEDPQEAFDLYFDDHPDHESYSISPQEVHYLVGNLVVPSVGSS